MTLKVSPEAQNRHKHPDLTLEVVRKSLSLQIDLASMGTMIGLPYHW